MALTKTPPYNILSPDGNSFAIFLDINSPQVLKLKDINGNIDLVSKYLTPSGTFVVSIENVGAGAALYIPNTTNPAQFKTLTQGSNVVITESANEIEIAVPSVVGIQLYYGSFYDLTIQTTTGNTEELMNYSNTSLSSGVSIVSSSQIKVANAGIYNLQFSVQCRKTQGGSAESLFIYFKKNGSPIASSNTAIVLANNNQLYVGSWNFFESLNANDYLEIAWYTTDQHIQLYYQAGTVNYPAIPSVIATVNRVG